MEYFKWGVFHGGTLNNFENTKLIIAGVDWTLKYEWIFYCTLPLIALVIDKLPKRRGGYLLITMCIIAFIYPLKVSSFSSKYFILFGIGGVFSYLLTCITLPKWADSKYLSTFNFLILIGCLVYPNTLDGIHVLLISVFFFVTMMGNSFYGLFHTKGAILMGEASYSIYLLHGIVLYLSFTYFEWVDIAAYEFSTFLLFMPPLTITVLLLSVTTYYFIEKPFIAMGKKKA